MQQYQIDNLNNQISYQEGKIFVEPNKGYTSNLMKRLYQNGYRASTGGIMHYLYDSDNKKIATATSWVELLKETAILFR